jgi:hypothetical protein
MRDCLIGAACWLAMAGATSAQTMTSAGVKAGAVVTSVPNAGEVLDQISGVPSVDVSSKIGLAGGGFVEFSFTESFSFQPELLFVMKGAKLDLPTDAGTVTASINYLEFPLLARYNTSLSDTLDGFLLVGPSFGVKVGTNSEFDGSGGTVDLDLNPAIRSRDFGLAVGGGIERDPFFLEARYTFGLTDIATDIYDHEDTLKNRVFTAMIGIRIP